MVSPALQALYEGDAARAAELRASDDELPAYEAAAFGRVERLREVLDKDPDAVNDWSPDGFSPLHLAIFGGSVDAARLLLERGADANAMATHEQVKVPPLGTAAFVRSTEMARLLLDNGANVNGQGEGGFTALHSAVQNRDRELAQLLLERGADPTIATKDGWAVAPELAELTGERPDDQHDHRG